MPARQERRPVADPALREDARLQPPAAVPQVPFVEPELERGIQVRPVSAATPNRTSVTARQISRVPVRCRLPVSLPDVHL